MDQNTQSPDSGSAETLSAQNTNSSSNSSSSSNNEQETLSQTPPPPLPLLPPAANDPGLHLPLPLPSPTIYYDNYHHPLFPLVWPRLHCWADPGGHPTAFPRPLGPLLPSRYNLFGAPLRDFAYVNAHPAKLFVKWTLWYLEVDDDLFGRICPSDLNDMPCEWDELQGGCPMLRLCEMRHKYPNPHRGIVPRVCARERSRTHCPCVHDIAPSCRSIAKHLLVLPKEGRWGGNSGSGSSSSGSGRGNVSCWQRCEAVAAGEICGGGHDVESARAEAVYRYWIHRAEARGRGSRGWVKRDVWGNRWLRPIRPVDFPG